MVGLLVFQAWTGVGHVVRNPRRLFIVEEISIALFLVVARAFANAMTKEDKDKISALALGKASVFMLTAYTVFGLMPMIVMGAVSQCPGCGDPRVMFVDISPPAGTRVAGAQVAQGRRHGQ